MSKKAIVLLSGGLDSTTVAAIVKSQGYEICALSFRYGQRHQGELAAAESVAREFGIDKHVIADIDLRLFGGSALTADIDVPKDHDQGQNDVAPITYVPARNTIFCLSPWPGPRCSIATIYLLVLMQLITPAILIVDRNLFSHSKPWPIWAPLSEQRLTRRSSFTHH